MQVLLRLRRPFLKNPVLEEILRNTYITWPLRRLARCSQSRGEDNPVACESFRQHGAHRDLCRLVEGSSRSALKALQTLWPHGSVCDLIPESQAVAELQAAQSRSVGISMDSPNTSAAASAKLGLGTLNAEPSRYAQMVGVRVLVDLIFGV